MSAITFKDSGGAELRLVDHGSKTYRSSYFRTEALNSLQSIALRVNDVFLCSYPKSGCHWVWNICRMLLDGHTKGAYAMLKEDSMLENVTLTEAERLASPRLLSSHIHFDALPMDPTRHSNKIIFVYRNIKDTAVSFYYMHRAFENYGYQGTFNDYLSLYMSGKVDWGSQLDYLEEWDHVIKHTLPRSQVHVVSYENMHRDTMHEMRRLTQFLGQTHNDLFLETVREACSFNKLKAKKGSTQLGVDGQAVMYRKGIVGDWRNHFTVARNQEVDNIIKQRLGHTQFNFIYDI